MNGCYYTQGHEFTLRHLHACPIEARATQGADAPIARGDLSVVRRLVPYLWEFRGRVLLALAFLVTAKLANITVPIVMKSIVDGLIGRQGAARRSRVVAARLRAPEAFEHALQRAARHRVREGRAARHAAHRARGLPPPARAVAALPPRAPDRRPHARHRARHARHLDAALLHGVQRAAHAPRDRARHRLPHLQVRRLVRRDHGGRAGALRRAHLRDLRVAHRAPPPDERDGLEGQHQGDRFAPQLRDRQVFRQRGLRGEALRRQPAELRARGGEERDLARAAERGAGGRDRARGVAPHVARGRRHRERPPHAGRPGDGERAPHPALHPAQLPRRDVPRDQAGDGRHGEDVPAPRREPRGRGQARRAAARGDAAGRSASRTSTSATTASARS